jgi:DNA-binding NtrC family response regulator
MIDLLDDSTFVTADAACAVIESVPAPRQLQLVVLGGAAVASHLLDAGTVTIGRSSRSEVYVDDASVSRHHAALHIGEQLKIEDLGSANGTMVAGEKVPPNRPVSVRLGELIQVGNVHLLLQERTAPVRPRRLWSHDYFEARVEDECLRAEGTGGGFLVLRIIIHSGIEGGTPVSDGGTSATGGGKSALAIQHCLVDFLRRSDVISSYGPSEYDVLLCNTPAERADDIGQRIIATLRQQNIKSRIRTACYPRDGRTAHALIAHLASPEPRAAPGSAIVVEPVMRSLHAMADRIAASDLGILLLGETGVGKEIFAETIHRASGRAGRFVAVNCAALADDLLCSELFGHEKGAFTSAVTGKEGLLETAHNGTVLLDEVGDMPLATQAKLLRVIEERKLRRVGGVTLRRIDVRFVAATNRDLEADVERGAFRRDLYFRLNGVAIVIPPLRERPLEIEPLALSFAERAARHAGHPAPDFAPETLRLLGGYSWPGNIRELRNVVERAVALCRASAIQPEHLPTDRMRETIVTRGRPAPAGVDARRAPDERERIKAALARADGNQTVAARLLNMSRRTLINRLDEFGLPRPRKDRS